MSHATEQVDAAPAPPPASPTHPAGPTPIAATGATGGATGALTREQLAAFTQARVRGRKISRAATVAAVSGWTLAFFAFISLIGGVFSLTSLLLGVGLGIMAHLELRGSKGLRRFDETAPRRLAFNQIAIGAMIVVYCGWSIWEAVAGPGPYDSYLAQGGDTAEMIEPIAQLHTAMTSAFYALLICVSVVAQGCAALYHFTRRRHLIAFLRETPAWVVDALRAVAH
jgi:hypothetical protein